MVPSDLLYSFQYADQYTDNTVFSSLGCFFKAKINSLKLCYQVTTILYRNNMQK